MVPIDISSTAEMNGVFKLFQLVAESEAILEL